MRIGITGHRILGRAEAQEAIRTEIDAYLRAHARPGDEALSSLAIGADQVFAECAVARALRLHVVLPCRGYESTFAPGAELQGYEALLAVASEITTLVFAAPSEAAFEAAGRWIVDHCDTVIAVWDGKPAGGRGGTADIVAYTQARGVPLVVIHVDSTPTLGDA